MVEKSEAAITFNVCDWTAEPVTNRLFRVDEQVRVEPKVMRVLTYLAERRGEVVSRRELEANVWTGMVVTDDAVTNTIIKLRKALGDNARDPKYIETISKSGYRLITDTSTRTVPAMLSTGAASEHHPELRETPQTQWGWSRLLVAGLLGLSGILILWLTVFPREEIFERGDGTPTTRPVVAVLPFENLSTDSEQDYFSDGITEDLITDLSKVASLRVVARNSVFAYKGSTETEQQIGSQLRARYIVKGSVRRAEQRLRINVRLTDARDGRNRWAERYDSKISDIFHLQDEITHRVVSALRVELSPSERQRLVRDYTTSVEAYDWYLRGLEHYGRRSGEDNVLAKEFFERAIAIEPGFARAYAGLALTYSINSINGWGKSLKQSLAKAESLALKARQLDENLPQVQFVMGEVEMYRYNYTAALDQLAQAIELKPSYADAYALLAWILHFTGRPEEGLAAMDQAIDLNPRVPGAYRMVQGALRYELEEIGEAVRLLELAVEINPNFQLARVFLAAAYTAAGQSEAANWQVMEIFTLNPEFSLSDVDQGSPIRDPIYKERFLRDLQSAGLSY